MCHREAQPHSSVPRIAGVADCRGYSGRSTPVARVAWKVQTSLTIAGGRCRPNAVGRGPVAGVSSNLQANASMPCAMAVAFVPRHPAGSASLHTGPGLRVPRRVAARTKSCRAAARRGSETTGRLPASRNPATAGTTRSRSAPGKTSMGS